MTTPHSALPTPHLTTLAILYGRVSTDKQDTERQDYALAAYCQRLGFTISDVVLNDPDTSGGLNMLDREGGRKLFTEIERLKSAHPGASIAVITTEQDRIGRDIVDSVGTIRRIWELGATPHFVLECGAVPRSPDNEMIVGIKASIAQHMRDKLKQVIKSKFAAKRAAGELCGTPRYGWDAIATTRTTAKGVIIRQEVENPIEQRWLAQMAAWHAGGWSLKAIADELNRLGVPTKCAAGTVMNPHQVAKGMKAIIASGVWQFGNVAKVLKAWRNRQKSAGENPGQKAA